MQKANAWQTPEAMLFVKRMPSRKTRVGEQYDFARASRSRDVQRQG